jgi:hypothetical protein
MTPKSIPANVAECNRHDSWQPAPKDPGFKPNGIRERAVRAVYEQQGYSSEHLRKFRRPE